MSTSNATLLQEITVTAEAIAASDAAAAGPHWGAIHRLLLKAKADPATVAHLVATRDQAGLERLIRSLRGETVAAATTPEGDGAPARQTVDRDTMESALRAFRKRLKLTRLDHESKLSVRPLTSGRKHDVDAMMPPREFSPAVWEALADAGKLRRAGPGFYSLVEEP